MERIYKRCPFCGEHIYRDEFQCRYCKRRLDMDSNGRRGGRYTDDNYRDDNYPDELYDDDGYRENYSHRGRPGDDYDRGVYRPDGYGGNGRSFSGVEIGAVLLIAALVGVLFYLLISH